MAPLSRVLSGVILPHDYYGSHLDSRGKTTDDDLELKNFEFAGQALAEIWSELNLDGHNGVAEFVLSEETVPNTPDCEDEIWYQNHVCESQYLLQIVKCDNKNSCPELRSNLKQVLCDKFLRGPFPLSQEPFGIPSSDENTSEFPSFLLRQALTVRPEYSKIKETPYDLHCLSQRGEIRKRVCQICGLYFASVASIKKHTKNANDIDDDSASRVRPIQILNQRAGELLCVTSNDTAEWVDVKLVDSTNSLEFHERIASEDSMPVINDIASWITDGFPFVEDTLFSTNS